MKFHAARAGAGDVRPMTWREVLLAIGAPALLSLVLWLLGAYR